MKKKMTGWQAFETANKYYVINTGALWIVASIALLILLVLLDPYPSKTYLGFLLINVLAGVLVLYLGLKSKVSGVEES